MKVHWTVLNNFYHIGIVCVCTCGFCNFVDCVTELNVGLIKNVFLSLSFSLIFIVTSNKIEFVDFGRGYLYCQSYLNSAIHYSLYCENNRWSFCIGIIILLCWFIHGFHTQNIHRLLDGSLLWIIAYIPLCIHIMRYVQWAISHHVLFQWWLRQCNWHKWLLAVQ